MAILRETEVRRRPLKRRAFELNDAEAQNVRRALRVIRERFGTWEALAKRLGCTPGVLQRAAAYGPVAKRWQPSAAMALRAAQAAGVPIEDVLSGSWVREVPCPLCGRKG